MQVGILAILLLLILVYAENFPNINKRAGWNKDVQVGIFQKINKICCMIIWEVRLHNIL